MSGAHPFIDAQGESRHLLQVLDGRIKLVLLLAALSLNLTAGGLLVPWCLAAISLLLVLSAGVGVGAFFKRMAVPVLLGSVALITQLFWYQEGRVILTVDIGLWHPTIHAGGLQRGLEIASRIVGGMATLLFFSLTTPLQELMRAARSFHVPPVLTELTLIMYRYIFLLLEEGGRIRNAQKARLGFVGFRNGLRSASVLGGMLVLRTYDRAERSFAAMRCRGYRGVLTTAPPGHLQGRDWMALVLGLGLLMGLYSIR